MCAAVFVIGIRTSLPATISVNTTFKDTTCGVNRVRQMARMFDALAQAEADGTVPRQWKTGSQESVPLSGEDVLDGGVAAVDLLLEEADAGVSAEVFTDSDVGYVSSRYEKCLVICLSESYG